MREKRQVGGGGRKGKRNTLHFPCDNKGGGEGEERGGSDTRDWLIHAREKKKKKKKVMDSCSFCSVFGKRKKERRREATLSPTTTY